MAFSGDTITSNLTDNKQMWTPIQLNELFDHINSTEELLTGELNNFWELIKMDPEKWKENKYGEEGGGFWVVAISGRQVIWYNDIEEGFNISTYKIYGDLSEYCCNQDTLTIAVGKLFYILKEGGHSTGHESPPINL